MTFYGEIIEEDRANALNHGDGIVLTTTQRTRALGNTRKEMMDGPIEFLNGLQPKFEEGVDKTIRLNSGG